MLKFILQLFGGRGAGSGNKGGAGGSGTNGFGVKPTGANGKFSVGDLVKGGKTWAADNDVLVHRSEATVGHAVSAVYDAVPNAKAIKFVASDGKTFKVVVQSTDGKNTTMVMRPGKQDGKNGVEYVYKDSDGNKHKGFATY